MDGNITSAYTIYIVTDAPPPYFNQFAQQSVSTHINICL